MLRQRVRQQSAGGGSGVGLMGASVCAALQVAAVRRDARGGGLGKSPCETMLFVFIAICNCFFWDNTCHLDTLPHAQLTACPAPRTRFTLDSFSTKMFKIFTSLHGSSLWPSTLGTEPINPISFSAEGGVSRGVRAAC